MGAGVGDESGVRTLRVQRKSLHEVRVGAAIEGGHYMRCAAPVVDDYTGCETCGGGGEQFVEGSRSVGAGVGEESRARTLRVERKHRLNGDVHAFMSILLEHHLRHSLEIDLRVYWGLGEEHLAPAGVNAEFLVECVVPQQLHVFPAPYDAVLHRLCDLERIAKYRRPRRRS